MQNTRGENWMGHMYDMNDLPTFSTLAVFDLE